MKQLILLISIFFSIYVAISLLDVHHHDSYWFYSKYCTQHTSFSVVDCMYTAYYMYCKRHLWDQTGPQHYTSSIDVHLKPHYCHVKIQFATFSLIYSNEPADLGSKTTHLPAKHHITLHKPRAASCQMLFLSAAFLVSIW